MDKFLITACVLSCSVQVFAMQQTHIISQIEGKQQADHQQQEAIMSNEELYSVVEKILEKLKECALNQTPKLISKENDLVVEWDYEGASTIQGLHIKTKMLFEPGYSSGTEYIVGIMTPWGFAEIFIYLGIKRLYLPFKSLRENLEKFMLDLVKRETSRNFNYEITSFNGKKMPHAISKETLNRKEVCRLRSLYMCEKNLKNITKQAHIYEKEYQKNISQAERLKEQIAELKKEHPAESTPNGNA